MLLLVFFCHKFKSYRYQPVALIPFIFPKVFSFAECAQSATCFDIKHGGNVGFLVGAGGWVVLVIS